jgi:hypothetical protein
MEKVGRISPARQELDRPATKRQGWVAQRSSVVVPDLRLVRYFRKVLNKRHALPPWSPEAVTRLRLPQNAAKRRAAGILAKHDDASRRVRLSVWLGALHVLPLSRDCAELHSPTQQ